MNIEELAGLGRIRKECEPFEGLKVMFHTLTLKEEKDVNVALSSYPQDILTRSIGIQIETLVRTIESIGEKTFTDLKELKEYLEGLQRHTISILWNAWSDEFDKESLKNVEDLKKNSGGHQPV
jgi:hypothetical protein